jgi:hypothetical protein
MCFFQQKNSNFVESKIWKKKKKKKAQSDGFFFFANSHHFQDSYKGFL